VPDVPSSPPVEVTLASILAERRRMETAGVDPSIVDPDPMVQFGRWYDEVIDAGINQPDAMALATVDHEGRPEVRHVLLKGVDERGLSFYTNYESDKAAQIAGAPDVSVVFPWLQVNRQVRVRGVVGKVSAEESDAYWVTRPRGSQLGAWASAQSRVIPGRDWLDRRLAQLGERYGETDPIPRPPHWGGYLIDPEMVELWQGRADRLHDRVRYLRQPDGSWATERLSP